MSSNTKRKHIKCGRKDMQHKGNKKTLSAYLGMQLGNQEVIKLAKEVEVQQKGFCR